MMSATPSILTSATLAHPTHDHDGGTGTSMLEELLPLLAVVLAAVVYLLLWRWARRRNAMRGPGPARAATFLVGCAVLALALSPP